MSKNEQKLDTMRCFQFRQKFRQDFSYQGEALNVRTVF